MQWEKRLAKWADAARAHAPLPLRLCLWNGRQFDLSAQPPQVTVIMTEPSAATYFLNPSLDNLGKAYVEGKLDIEGGLHAVIDIAAKLAAHAKEQGPSILRHIKMFSHTRKKDAQAIRYHYDVSNPFYQYFLDKNMVYSCAYLEYGEETLEQAQLKKIDHILKKIRLQPDQTLLDIGCGWGALVMRAAEKFGARCTGITLSENQYALARERVEQAGLTDRVSIRLEDYRDMTGRFDRITSVGMFEHVGRTNLPLYFKKIRSLISDDGLIMNHGITATNSTIVGVPPGGSEFMEQYVFPDSELIDIGTVLTAMQDAGLEILDVENLRRHYAKTCANWAQNFEQHAAQIRSLVDDRHYRIWRVYLAGCAHAFTHDWMSLHQIICTRSGQRAGTLPISRRYMYS